VGLAIDSSGNLYGTTYEGGSSGTGCAGGGCGTVFELSPGAGQFTETIIHNFSDNGVDGYEPQTRLILDGSGNLYGTTPLGGSKCNSSFGFCGTAYRLTPGANGQWTETVLHAFLGGTQDGLVPLGDLTLDKSGNLYGTTNEGGSAGLGTAFELVRGAGGKFTIKLLHDFPSGKTDGNEPSAGLAFGKGGNLYGTTYYGGAAGSGGDGIIFEVTP
jgi:uncharacterized repeat protein (TIGR03803 family)